MHHSTVEPWAHSHNFTGDSSGSERRTRVVIFITAGMMIVEIVAGSALNSMALFADGWHMATHVTAFLITALAYFFSRRHLADPRFSFGTGKIGVMGGFISAVILGIIALFMAFESVLRFFAPLTIHYDEAILIAGLGLLVNVSCALVLNQGEHHHHGHLDHHGGHGHGGSGRHDEAASPHSHGHGGDLNLRSAYIHVIADAFTSLTAIAALVCAKFFHWTWSDPVMGIVGAGVVVSWAVQLMRSTGGILIDRTPEWSDLVEEITKGIESDGDSRISDLHVWQIGAGLFAAIVSIVAENPQSAEQYRQRLLIHEELVHITIEVHSRVRENSGLARVR